MTSASSQDTFRHQGLRKALIQIIKEKGIQDQNVCKAMERVPRHLFLDGAFAEHAYEDKAFPIGHGQTISQPYTVARQTELLQIKPRLKILEIGTGSGYQAAILYQMGAKVHTIEYNKPLYLKTREFLRINYKGIQCFHGDGTKGLPTFAPFDRILVTAGGHQVPGELLAQLKPGGILVIPLGDRRLQEMTVIYKDKEGNLRQENHGHYAFVPLLGREGWQE